MELSELQTDGDNKRKGRQLRWTYGMDECMIETFLEQARLGHKGNKGFEDQAYKAVIKALAERLDTEVCKYHINHRLKSFRTEYRMFTILREQNGFVWDSTKNKVIAQDSTWNDYIKAYPKFKSYRGRACKWNFDSLGIILGKDHVSECSSTDCPDSSDSQPDLDSNEKGRQVRWSQEMDKCMIATFVGQARLGLKGEKGFKDKAYAAVCKSLVDELGVDVCKTHIDNRLRTFRTEYHMFHTLREHSDFCWDPAKNKITAPDSIWNDYLKEHPEFKSYRGRQCKWDYESLGIIVGNNQPAVSYGSSCLNASESYPEEDDKGKGKQLRWTREMDQCMIETIIKHARLSNKGNKGFKDHAYEAVRKALSDQLYVDVCRKHIDNRLKSFRTEYHMFRTLREQSGFEWDSSENTVTASDNTWNDFIKAHPKFKHYRGRACKWDYESLDIIVGNNQVSGSYFLNCFEPIEPQPEVDNMEKGNQLEWTQEMDECMIETLVKQVGLGNKGNLGFKDQAYDAVSKVLVNELNVDVCRKQIDDRLITLRTEYYMFQTLLEQKGIVWDSATKTITASDDIWNDFIEAHPKFKHYRGSACKWDYDSLGIIVGNDSIGQSVAMCGPNAAVVDMASGPTEDVEFSNELPLIDANVSHYDTDDEEERMSQDIKRTLSPCTPYLAQKRARTADVVREVMDVVNEKIGSIAKVADGLSFAKELYTEVMKVEGFSPDFLDRAFEILKRDGHGAEIFLVRTEPYRKRMLKELYDKYGDNGTSGLGGHGENGSAV
ncbi:hypothetical protein AQUCO_00900465v1 [Aquilegia coerulea]|uniref:Myb/SANT-like domain-containing protein n=2 Tax=Aquilegia coerulea TaxID=218851 RepID=A0A2G5EDR7_AQUCA|nr:hypothetical protein AQUCO_00900465v1 [Aquilegia coerulea]